MDTALAHSFNPEQLHLDPTRAWELQNAGAGVIVDVRLPEEREWFAQIPGAITLPLDCLQHLAGFGEHPLDSGGERLEPQERRTLLSMLMHHASAGNALLLFCARGDRSLEAAQILRDLGYLRAYCVAGGLHTWEQRGLPLIRPGDV